jgi:hypothetical protein
MNTEKASAVDVNVATLLRKGENVEQAEAHGKFVVECFDKDGNLKWRDTIENVVTILGKNVALDAFLAGSAYTVVGPYMGLISSVGYTGVPVEGDTMASHTTWEEAGPSYAPDYSGDRKTCVWSAAGTGSKALSAALSFVFSEGGTVKGCFLVFFTSAVVTKDDTNGTLYSAGLFTGGDKVVVNTDTLNVSYTASL